MASAARVETVELDELTVTVVVDNATDTLSSITPGAPQLPEMVFLLDGPSIGNHDGHDMVVTLDRLCVACHGFSALATARAGDRSGDGAVRRGPVRRRVAGQCRAAGRRPGEHRRALRLPLALGPHRRDPDVVAAVTEARTVAGLPPLLVDVHPDRPDQRGLLTALGKFAMLPAEPTFAAIEAAGGQIVRHADAHAVGGGLFLASGDIPRTTSYETGLREHHTWRDGQAAADPEIHDERFLAARVRGRGTTVLSACSHAGIVNVGLEARRLLPDTPVDVLLGGYHLAGASVEPRIDQTVKDLADLVQPRFVAPGHCTGWRAATALADAFGPARLRAERGGDQVRARCNALTTRSGVAVALAAWPCSRVQVRPPMLRWPQTQVVAATGSTGASRPRRHGAVLAARGGAAGVAARAARSA